MLRRQEATRKGAGVESPLGSRRYLDVPRRRTGIEALVGNRLTNPPKGLHQPQFFSRCGGLVTISSITTVSPRLSRL